MAGLDPFHFYDQPGSAGCEVYGPDFKDYEFPVFGHADAGVSSVCREKDASCGANLGVPADIAVVGAEVND